MEEIYDNINNNIWIDKIKNIIMNNDLIIFKGCSHNVHLEEPEKFNNTIRNFLK